MHAMVQRIILWFILIVVYCFVWQALKDRTGSSATAIKAWIVAEYPALKWAQHNLRAALKKGAESGQFKQIKASFKMGEKAKKAAPKKAAAKPAAKKVGAKPAAKKAAPKKAAAKPAAKKAAPKKAAAKPAAKKAAPKKAAAKKAAPKKAAPKKAAPKKAAAKK